MTPNISNCRGLRRELTALGWEGGMGECDGLTVEGDKWRNHSKNEQRKLSQAEVRWREKDIQKSNPPHGNPDTMRLEQTTPCPPVIKPYQRGEGESVTPTPNLMTNTWEQKQNKPPKNDEENHHLAYAALTVWWEHAWPGTRCVSEEVPRRLQLPSVETRVSCRRYSFLKAVSSFGWTHHLSFKKIFSVDLYIYII